MSAIGFSPQSPSELDQLREAYRSLNDITRNALYASFAEPSYGDGVVAGDVDGAGDSDDAEADGEGDAGDGDVH